MCKDGHQTKNVKKSQQGSRLSRVKFHVSGLLLDKVFNLGQNKLKRVSRHPQPFLERGFVPVLVSVRPPIRKLSRPCSFLLLFVITIADITAGSEALVSKSISLMKRFLATSSFIFYWRLKNSSTALLLRENNFTSCNRAAILNFAAINPLVPIPFYFASRNSSHC